MSEFLQRNKKKGAMSLVLLFFKRGKGIGPILLVVGLLSLVFVAPRGFLMNIPWASRVASKLGLERFLGGGKGARFDKLSQALRDERERRRLQGEAGWFGRGGADSLGGGSTVDYVKGGKSIERGDSRRYYDGVSKDAGESIDGVLRPEDSKKLEEGLPLTDGEMESGLMKSAFAGMFADGKGAGDPAFADRMGLRGGGGSVSGARAAGADEGMVRSALDGSGVPLVGRARPKGVAGGKLGWKKFRKINARMSRALATPKSAGRGTVMYQLAEGRAYSIAAAPPPGNCDPGNCPAEYASIASGAVFDGGSPNDDILSSSEFGDPGVQVPGQGEVNTLIEEAEQMEEDAKKCEQAEEEYGPQERRKMAEIQDLANQLNGMGCGGGGCSRSLYSRCMAVGGRMRAKCHEYNQVAQKKAQACPLMNGEYSRMDCNQ
ncbi:MAG: hypothetical protein ABII00_06715 [Elusimicrobiota bacterium]